MKPETGRKYALGGLLFSVMAGLLFVNNGAVVRAEDQYCNKDPSSPTCFDNPNDKCSSYQGYACRLTKDETCACVLLDPN